MQNTSPTNRTPSTKLEKTHEAQCSDLTTYYRTISAIGKIVIADKKAKGERMHLAPLGWLNARDERGRSIIVPDPARYELVQEAKRLHEQGMSIRKICALMEEKGLKSKRGKIISAMAMWKSITSIRSN